MDNKEILKKLKRLEEYESTGVEPEVIKELAKYDVNLFILFAELTKQVNINLLVKITKATMKGVAVILPCRIGDTVYRIVNDATPHIVKDKTMMVHITPQYEVRIELVGGRDVRWCDFGDIVFLDQEEAEKKISNYKTE